MKVLKAIANFFKNKKVQIWACIMAGVIVVAFGVMSWVMVTDKVEFGHLTYYGLAFDEERKVVIKAETETAFEFMPDLKNIDTITISNENEDRSASGPVQLNNNMIGGELDPVVLKSEAKIVNDIWTRLNKGRKTNAFMQFFTGGKSGEERLVSTITSSYTFEEASKGVWIKIVFAAPQFVVNRDSNSKWCLEEFNPNYTQHVDENGRPSGQNTNQYKNSVINAIHIPLGGARNAFTQQTWYLSIGTKEITNTSTLGYTFTTYGNYYNLLKYVRNIDDEKLL